MSARRLLLLVNFAAIPYVWFRFPREARAYTRDCFRALSPVTPRKEQR